MKKSLSLPEAVQKALGKQKKIKDYFDSLPYSLKKEYVVWIEEAKKPETKAARIAKMMAMLTKKIKQGKRDE
jgi:uncharacterized protein YdeI (YjbR/CyaY-like superfamily)